MALNVISPSSSTGICNVIILWIKREEGGERVREKRGREGEEREGGRERGRERGRGLESKKERQEVRDRRYLMRNRQHFKIDIADC